MRTGFGRQDPATHTEVAFIHVPKTGGTFIGQFETGDGFIVRPLTYLGHATVLDHDGTFDHDVARPYARDVIVPRASIADKIIVANVRNVFAFLVSYLHHSGGYNPRYRDIAHYDYENARKGFDYLLRTIADREELWPSRRFIHYQLFAQPSGVFLPAWINYTEFLDSDLKRMAARFRLECHHGQKQRVSGYKDYRCFYDDSLIDLVMRTWQREIDLFGFDFDDRRAPDRAAALRRLASASYVWRRDELKFGTDTLFHRLRSRMRNARSNPASE